MWTTARVARMVVTADPATARRCDDLVRAEVIARLQGLELTTVSIVGTIGVFGTTGAAHAAGAAGSIAALACFLSAVYCIVCTLVLLGLEERLGGAVTGWWGRPMPS
jgi:hypothetical protein